MALPPTGSSSTSYTRADGLTEEQAQAKQREAKQREAQAKEGHIKAAGLGIMIFGTPEDEEKVRIAAEARDAAEEKYYESHPEARPKTREFHSRAGFIAFCKAGKAREAKERADGLVTMQRYHKIVQETGLVNPNFCEEMDPIFFNSAIPVGTTVFYAAQKAGAVYYKVIFKENIDSGAQRGDRLGMCMVRPLEVTPQGFYNPTSKVYSTTLQEAIEKAVPIKLATTRLLNNFPFHPVGYRSDYIVSMLKNPGDYLIITSPDDIEGLALYMFVKPGEGASIRIRDLDTLPRDLEELAKSKNVRSNPIYYKPKPQAAALGPAEAVAR